MRTFEELFPNLPVQTLAVAREKIAGLTADSRQVEPGYVFFAIAGQRRDGAAYAAEAVARGALAIIAEQSDQTGLAAPTIVVDDVRAALAAAAARFYPRQPATIAAVTGTSGKTSVAFFTRQIWASLGQRAAAVGTIGVIAPSGANSGALTTPDPVALHQILDQLAQDGVTHLAMEASSHGLDQKRLDGVRLAAGAFTNLSRDHLDYHADLAAYFKAKLRLFEELLAPGQPAVIDADSDAGQAVAAACRARGLRVFDVGRRGSAIRLRELRREPQGALVSVDYDGRAETIALPLAGDFMAANALVAAGLCIATGSDPGGVFAALASLRGVPGRMERVGERRGAAIFVDYAHKPDALEKLLTALRPLAERRLIVVFGCGGDRDQGKRPIMGAIAARLADVVIVTDDNPRSEAAADIRKAILAGAPDAREIGDRAAAIKAGVALLERGDVLAIAGKGHESGQIVAGEVLPFSDHEAVRKALSECGE